jgi:hypothetical protein
MSTDTDQNMQLIQYPGTFFYYRWRNNTKAKKWDALSLEQQHEYRQTTTDTGNKRYGVLGGIIFRANANAANRLDFRFAT